MTRRRAQFASASGILLSALLSSAPASAAAPWVERTLTLPKSNWAFNVGGGIAASAVQYDLGVNTEMAVGLSDTIELGVRSALRLGDAAGGLGGEKGPDDFGRLFDRETFDEGDAAVANSEVRLRAAVVQGDVGEVALEGRLVVPTAKGTATGLLFGLPLAFHIADVVRLDLGVYAPVVIDAPHGDLNLSIPFNVWIQITTRFWIGPMTGISVLASDQGLGHPFPWLGLGLGYEINRRLDFKAMGLCPDLSEPGDRDCGLGAGVEIRVE